MASTLTTGDVARLFGVSLYTVRRWTEAGRLQASFKTLGGHYRFDRAAVEALASARGGETRGEDPERVVGRARGALDTPTTPTHPTHQENPCD